MKTVENLIGKRFGRLLVVEYVGLITRNKNPKRFSAWRCKCDCGNFKIIRHSGLVSGNSKSCGCFSRELGNKKQVMPDNMAARKRIYGNYKRDALDRGLEFSLTFEEFDKLIRSDCYYCGIQPNQSYKGLLKNGVDRVDNSLGYILSNVVPCCKNCNFSKRDLGLEEFMLWVERIYKRQYSPINI